VLSHRLHWQASINKVFTLIYIYIYIYHTLDIWLSLSYHTNIKICAPLPNKFILPNFVL
jgi:hypothetical protein